MPKQSHFTLRRELKALTVTKEQLLSFAVQLDAFLQDVERNRTEEEQKNFLQRFLETAFYAGCTLPGVNAYDLVLYSTEKKTDIEVLMEVKSTSNTTEMPTPHELNKKALQQLVVYYLRERVTNKNKSLRHLVVTNLYTFFCFDATVFYEEFYKKHATTFCEIETGQHEITKSADLYKAFAYNAIEAVKSALPFDYVDLREYRDAIQEVLDGKENKELTELYKFFSPSHLLKRPLHAEPNQLDRHFYNELLYLLGLEEQKGEGSKIVIARARKPNYASLIEQTYAKVELAFDSFLQREQYGATSAEQKFNIALELVITWLNRILFLKLLETQLLNYNAANSALQFLNKAKIRDFTALNNLFFAVLAIPIEQRSGAFKERFCHVPYLNSSLFEETALEHEVKISGLESQECLPLYAQSILKKERVELPETLPIFDYLFAFLEAYDFGSWQEDETMQRKTLINASVLGLIFEKINGHKDGAIFTPSYITAYICRETIERAIIDKFNARYEWQCRDITELYNQLDRVDKRESNTLFNTITICDPAVGSGHFLVSALNELIYLKHRLGILQDERGQAIRHTDYEIEIVNDELQISVAGKQFFYTPTNAESQRVQEILFNEKRYLIEHCLFGVDINPTSVQICRLRLWIELLKHAYYTRESDYKALETLPNIDINIKCGNAVVYSLPLRGKWNDPNAQNLRELFAEYYTTSEKGRKRTIVQEIEGYNNALKEKLRAEETRNAQELVLYWEKEVKTLTQRYNEATASEWNKYNPTVVKTALKQAKEAYKKATQALEDVYRNNASARTFEWRLEFPEVWDSNGEFVGFDIVLGNPPYIKEYENKLAFTQFKATSPYYMGKMDLWYGFLCVGLDLLRADGLLCFIATNNWTTSAGAKKMRERILEVATIRSLIDFNDYMVFENASIQTMILLLQRRGAEEKYSFDYRKLSAEQIASTDAIAFLENTATPSDVFAPVIDPSNMSLQSWTFVTAETDRCLASIERGAQFFRENEIAQGIVCPQDVLNRAGQAKLRSGQIGDGIMVLSQKEINSLELCKHELDLLRPYYTTEEVQRYYCNPQNTSWIIYTDGKANKKFEEGEYPSLKRHLDKYETVITSSNKPYGLHRARKESFFLGEKIICQRKCIGKPSFAYAAFPTYVSATFYVIKTERFDLKFLTGLLNSKLIAFWLRHKGKMQGRNYQIDKEPLLQIPIKSIGEIDKQIVQQVEKILQSKRTAPETDTSAEEAEIDSLVYQLYGLDLPDIAIIEKGS